ncbi:ATP-dependent RNA helicase RhlE [Pseudoalteromonas sp. P1-9]|uniref:DEAD/DEAH box helicase n=1 Tax=Pseudoalteromonas sp. P1-9 TaxID=1710354 RepID=UPI0006D61361|nr:DEAD/DEAH box helicase [Pseudoalteromonas sp. P1-9]KPV95675.1 ATP-dependent RNA helicase RhlE [Pseudoalteromonas sp. P1-9]
MNFKSFSFADSILSALEKMGYESLTPVQKMAIPHVRRGHDVLASAQTGTGKTAAFALPIIQKLLDSNANGESIRAVILAPTRELVDQIDHNIKQFTAFNNLKSVAIFGGVEHDKQINRVNKGCDILVATPGRLIEHLRKGNFALNNACHVVLDEADRMLDMGFRSDIETILEQCDKNKQTLLFSATYPSAVKQFATKALKNPKIVQVSRDNETASTITHVAYPVSNDRKLELLSELICRKGWKQVLVFVNMKEDVQLIVDELTQYGVTVGVMHGDKSQGNRRRALREFKDGKTTILVGTEVAARGLDIAGLPRVINFDLPYLAEDYVHRIGRTGRAGQKGFAISLVSREEEHVLAQIEDLIQDKVKRIYYPGFEVSNRDGLIKKIGKKTSLQKRIRSNRATQYGAEAKMQNRQKIRKAFKK